MKIEVLGHWPQCLSSTYQLFISSPDRLVYTRRSFFSPCCSSVWKTWIYLAALMPGPYVTGYMLSFASSNLHEPVVKSVWKCRELLGSPRSLWKLPVFHGLAVRIVSIFTVCRYTQQVLNEHVLRLMYHLIACSYVKKLFFLYILSDVPRRTVCWYTFFILALSILKIYLTLSGVHTFAIN